MKRYIILCDHDIRWRNKMADMLRKFNIEIVFAEMLEDVVEMLQKMKYSLVVCSEYEFDEYCKTYEVASGITVEEILKSNTNMVIISECTYDDKEIELFERGVIDYQWRERDINIIARRILNAAFLKKDSWYNIREKVDLILYEEERLSFTPKELDLLNLLASYNGKIVSKKEIIHNVWNDNYKTGSRAIDTLVKQLRAKIEKYGLQIINKYREGYYIDLM